MNKKHLNLGGILCLIAGVYCINYILLKGNSLPWSINSVELSLTHWVKHWHVIVVGLMPVYVALTLFGVAMFSLFVGSVVQHWVSYFLHEKVE